MLLKKSAVQKSNNIPRHTLKDRENPGLFIKRIGRHADEAMKTYPHRDDYFMIVVITGGSALVSVDFREMTLTAGDALILTPSLVHWPVSASDTIDGWLIGLAPEHFTENESDEATIHLLNGTPIHLPNTETDQIDKLCGVLEYHSDHYPIAGSLAQTIKRLVIFQANDGSQSGTSRHMAIASRLKKLVAERMKELKSPSGYAELMNISEVYLNEAVKATTGTSAGNFIRKLIITEAKRQLVYTSRPTQEVAYALGYDDYAYFSKLFKKESGISPNEYRKKIASSQKP